MATNHYFNHYGENTPDQRLIESLIIESIKVYGIDVHYMPRTLIKEDSLYGEDRLSQFKDQRSTRKQKTRGTGSMEIEKHRGSYIV